MPRGYHRSSFIRTASVKRTYHVLAWLIIVLGLRHALPAHGAFVEGQSPWSVGFFLVSLGLLYILTGAQHLVHVHTRVPARAVGYLSAGTSLAVAALTL